MTHDPMALLEGNGPVGPEWRRPGWAAADLLLTTYAGNLDAGMTPAAAKLDAMRALCPDLPPDYDSGPIELVDAGSADALSPEFRAALFPHD